jgi:hypothetical protein
MKVAVDLDDTLWDFFGAVANVPGCPPITREQHTRWETLPDLLGGVRRMKEIFNGAFTAEALLEQGLFEHAEEAFAQLQEHGVKLTVLTHRPAWSITAARKALAELGLVDVRVVGCRSDRKVAYCIEHGIDVLVDDHPLTQVEAVAAGIKVYSFRYEYNRGAKGVRFVKSWSELASLLEWRQRRLPAAAVALAS